MRRLFGPIVIAISCATCTVPAAQLTTNSAGADATAHQAHETYVTAINSNNLDTLLGMLTEDVVFLSAHEPVMAGKAAVRPWLAEPVNSAGVLRSR